MRKKSWIQKAGHLSATFFFFFDPSRNEEKGKKKKEEANKRNNGNRIDNKETYQIRDAT